MKFIAIFVFCLSSVAFCDSLSVVNEVVEYRQAAFVSMKNNRQNFPPENARDFLKFFKELQIKVSAKDTSLRVLSLDEIWMLAFLAKDYPQILELSSQYDSIVEIEKNSRFAPKDRLGRLFSDILLDEYDGIRENIIYSDFSRETKDFLILNLKYCLAKNNGLGRKKLSDQNKKYLHSHLGFLLEDKNIFFANYPDTKYRNFLDKIISTEDIRAEVKKAESRDPFIQTALGLVLGHSFLPTKVSKYVDAPFDLGFSIDLQVYRFFIHSQFIASIGDKYENFEDPSLGSKTGMTQINESFSLGFSILNSSRWNMALLAGIGGGGLFLDDVKDNEIREHLCFHLGMQLTYIQPITDLYDAYFRLQYMAISETYRNPDILKDENFDGWSHHLTIGIGLHEAFYL
ncbi:MAG: hypothetical protein M0P13_00640 [Fibrobacteraceae bacterium]|nr:hypothetical protein [Fibrobacteraceae bacterium]